MWLYPRQCRAEFADEMLDVVRAGATEVGGEAWMNRVGFHTRELAGFLAGALDERLRFKPNSYFKLPPVWRRIAMRSSFRFPKSVAPMMTLVFAVVLFTIARAASTAVMVTSPHVTTAGERLSLPLSVGLWLGFAYLVGVLAWLLVHALHQSGAQRMSNIQTWPQK
jgi:hypothetical protein